MNRGRPRHDDVLTPREWEVLGCIREGLTNEEIAERLGISHNTVKYHVSDILGKLDVSSREQAAAWRGKPKVAFGFGLPLLLGNSIASTSAAKVVGVGAIGAAIVGLVLLALGVILSNGDASMGKIAYVRDGNIWVQELPNGTPYQVTDSDGAWMPSWSPSGEWLLYLIEDPTSDLQRASVVVRPDGSGERRLETQRLSTAYWLPDSDDRLVYTVPDEVTISEDADGANREVLTEPFVNADGDKVVRFPFPGLPDSNKQIYVEARYREDSRDPSPTPFYQGFGISDADGSNARLLLDFSPDSEEQLIFRGWSSDGSSLLYSTYVDDRRLSEQGLEYKAQSLDGGPPRDLGLSGMFTLSGSQNPNGWAVVAGGDSASWSNKRIAVIAPDASSFEMLTDPDVAAIAPAWAPDGSQIAYVAAPDLGPEAQDDALAQRRIWLMDPDGTNKRQLTSGEGFRDASPIWSQDGTHLLFARMSTEDPCYSTSYDLMRYDLEDGTLDVIIEGLPLFGSIFDVEIGEIPQCESSIDGINTQTYGSLNLPSVLAWWQPQPD